MKLGTRVSLSEPSMPQVSPSVLTSINDRTEAIRRVSVSPTRVRNLAFKYQCVCYVLKPIGTSSLRYLILEPYNGCRRQSVCPKSMKLSTLVSFSEPSMPQVSPSLRMTSFPV
ncbi:hypothetical protein DPMN_148457 [Dreissena polymorpha]|uniref:Uncharacterized protein n=1 Tax=Dreissena polymorpha TaxID=45954 RepID=A0A9D4J4D3_DREPO|nr:hypothetical protein DPMN_148457 [Dreissena polymorpha]